MTSRRVAVGWDADPPAANAEEPAHVERLLDEQAALRRVATLVAESPESEDLFSAVAREVAAVLEVSGVIVDRFDADGSQTTLGSWYDLDLEGAAAFLGVGVRLPLHPGTLAAGVFETHRAARVDDYSTLEGMMGDAARAAGVGSGCGAPIIVDGELWGQMCAFSRRGTVLPVGTEDRLDDFVKLLASAISNYDARANLRMMADEQAALRRVATTVAQGATPEEVFRAVASEVDVLFGGDVSAIVQFEASHETATVLGDIGGPHGAGDRVTLDPGYVVRNVRETGRSARFDTDDPSVAPSGSIVRSLGIRSAVASPIVVEGDLWGAITAASLTGPLAPAAERRMMEFTELVATAVANSQARELVTSLADEQAALRRVAELIAGEASPTDLFDTVAEEAARVLGIAAVGLLRFDPDGMATLVAGRDPQALDPGDPGTARQVTRPSSPWDRPPPGTQFALDGENPIAEVLRTGQRLAWTTGRRPPGPWPRWRPRWESVPRSRSRSLSRAARGAR